MKRITVEPDRLLIISNDSDARPFSYLEGEQRLGYEPAVVRAVTARLELEPVWFNLPLEDFYPSLSTGEYDVVWFNQAITQERRAWADFTRPYGRFDEAVLVRADSRLQGTQDLQGCRIGTMVSSTGMAVTEDFPDVEVVSFQGGNQVLPEMLAALEQGEIDALVQDELILQAVVEQMPSLRIAFTIPTQWPFGVGVLPGNRELLQALNQTLEELIADGTLAQIWQEWIPYKPFPLAPAPSA